MINNKKYIGIILISSNSKLLNYNKNKIQLNLILLNINNNCKHSNSSIYLVKFLKLLFKIKLPALMVCRSVKKKNSSRLTGNKLTRLQGIYFSCLLLLSLNISTHALDFNNLIAQAQYLKLKSIKNIIKCTFYQIFQSLYIINIKIIWNSFRLITNLTRTTKSAYPNCSTKRSHIFSATISK